MRFPSLAILFLIFTSFSILYAVSLIFSKYQQLQNPSSGAEKRNLLSEITQFKRSSVTEKEWEIYASKAFIYADKSIELENFTFNLMKDNFLYSISGNSAALALSGSELSSLKADGNVKIKSEQHDLLVETQVFILLEKNKALLERDVVVLLPSITVKSSKADIDFEERKIIFSGDVWSKILN